MQEVARLRRDADQRALPIGTAGDQAGGQIPVGDKAVAAVKIGHHLPVVLADDHRNMAQRPFPLIGAILAVLAEIDAGIVQILVAARKPLVDLVGFQRREVIEKRPPDRADPAVGRLVQPASV